MPETLNISLTEFCVVEAKGTAKDLCKLHLCPSHWKDQVNNMRLTLDGTPVHIARRIVVASRCCTIEQNAEARRIQIRAWNSKTESIGLPVADTVPIVVAHLVGLYRNLRLDNVALRLMQSAEQRAEIRSLLPTSETVGIANASEPNAESAVIPTDVSVPLFNQTLKVELSKPIRELTDGLIEAATVSDAAVAVIKGDAMLDQWNMNRDWTDAVPLPCGVLFRGNLLMHRSARRHLPLIEGLGVVEGLLFF